MGDDVHDMPEMKPCPFCGKSVDLDDPDVLHPSAVCWRDEDFGDGIEIRTYHSHRNRRDGDGQCWEINCPTPAWGCGANITADSEEEVIAKWNRRDAPQTKAKQGRHYLMTAIGVVLIVLVALTLPLIALPLALKMANPYNQVAVLILWTAGVYGVNLMLARYFEKKTNR